MKWREEEAAMRTEEERKLRAISANQKGAIPYFAASASSEREIAKYYNKYLY